MYRFKKIIFFFIILFFIILNINPENDINKKDKICIIYKKTKYKVLIVDELEKKLHDKRACY